MWSEPHTLVPKVWGEEEWVVNIPGMYCGKVLRLTGGFQCSLHYHPIKTETFYILSGIVQLETRMPDYRQSGEFRTLEVGNSITLPPGLAHRFASVEGAVIIEFSTTHSDNDVVRIEESGPLELK